MAAKRTCEECGAELPANAPQGLCPQCLARVAAGFASPVAATPHPDPKSGLGRIRYFGDYELLNEIARGGMGVVYRARQSSLNRVVAVKMLLFGKFASDEFVKRFHREAEAAASLQHANIVAVHEVGEHEGQHYFSMDYVAGKDLGELTRGNPLPARRAAGYLKTIAEAIHFAHQRGILHRDVKPSNVLIDEFDQPRITDFGLAKQLKGDPELTTTGQVLGSPNYMPPEQAEPRRGEVNAASDVYSLGAILYHLLTGRPPFLAETLEDTLRQLLNDEPVAPSRLNASVPRDLETICLKCLEKGPRRRYGSAHELADDLSRWLKGEPIHARPVTVLDRAVKWTKRQPAIAALAVSVLLLLIVVAVGSTIAAVRLERARRQTTEKLYDSYIAQARANRLSGRPGRYFDTMETIAKAVAIRPSLELRNEAIASFTVEDLRLLPLGETNPPSPGGIIFSSTLELFARVRADGDIAVRRVKDKQAVAVVPAHELGVRWLHGFTDDGRFLAFHTDKAGHCIWDIQERRMIFENLALTPGGGLVFLSQEDSFASVESDGAIAVYELKSRHMTRLPAKVSSGSGAMAFHSSSSRLACFNARMKLVEVVNLRTAELESSIKAPDHCEAIVWSDDGKKLAAASSNRRAYIWDAKSGELLQTCVGHDELITKLAFNHASTLLATTSWDDTTRLWDPMSGAQLLRMTGSSYQLQFSADDQRLGYVVQGARFGLLEVATHPEYRCLAPARRNGRGGALAVGPDSRLVAGLVEGRVCLWDFESGQEMGALREAGCASVFFDHDGDGLITCGLAGAAHWTIQRRTETNTFQIGDRQIGRASCRERVLVQV